MKILMFTPYVPYPPNSGGQTRTFNLIKNLSKKHDITSFCFLRTDQTEPDLRELRKYCKKIKIFRRKKAWASPEKIFKTGFSPYPYLVNMYNYASVKEEIAKELKENSYDLIHVETYYIMPNLPDVEIPVLLAEQTIEYLVYKHYAETTKLWPIKPLLEIDVMKHKRWEKYYWKKAKKVAAMSEADKQIMLDIEPNLDVDIVPNGIDVDYFNHKVVKKREDGTILFVGNFNWLQNREAVEVLVGKVWPLIKKQNPDVKLWIVGRSPSDSIKTMASGDITVSDDLDDIRIAYQKSTLLLAPIFGGGGTRYKILEAMASGLPVVTTHIGIEGIGAVNGSHALVSDDISELARLALEIINKCKKAEKIAISAKKLVDDNFSWTKISSKLEEIYEETARS